MIKSLILLRHGEAEHLLDGRIGGWTDSNLTKKGLQQAKSNLAFLSKTVSISDYEIYSSDLRRASETAKEFEVEMAKKIHFSRDLRELSNGLARNKSKVEAEKLYVPMTEPKLDWIPYPEAESWRMLCKRIYTFLDHLNRKGNPNIIIVSHKKALCAIIHWWLQFDYNHDNNVSYDLKPGSLTFLRINRWNERTIAKLNQTLHLF